MTLKSVGFIGLGHMGLPMASNLLKNGVKLHLYNRSKEKAGELLKQGAEWCGSPKELSKKSDLVFSMVANDEALKEITLGKNGLLDHAKADAIHVSMSTVSPHLIQELHAAYREKKGYLLSAPVFGRPDAAAQQKLWICLAGEHGVKQMVLPFLRFMGQKVYDFGDSPERANAVKLSGNFLILAIVEALSEAFSFAEKNGVDRSELNSFLGDSLFPSPVIQTYGRIVATRQFEPAGFKMELGLKDVNLLLQAADSSRVPLPLAALLHDRLLAGLANGRGEMDWSAIALSAFEEAGLY